MRHSGIGSQPLRLAASIKLDRSSPISAPHAPPYETSCRKCQQLFALRQGLGEIPIGNPVSVDARLPPS
jgi:hypothetical protein